MTHGVPKKPQCDKIGSVKSAQAYVKGSVPQGATLGIEEFCQLIEYFPLMLEQYKYVDYSITFDIVPKNEQNNWLQSAIGEAVAWTKSNDMIINVAKTKEMTMSSSKRANDFF